MDAPALGGEERSARPPGPERSDARAPSDPEVVAKPMRRPVHSRVSAADPRGGCLRSPAKAVGCFAARGCTATDWRKAQRQTPSRGRKASSAQREGARAPKVARRSCTPPIRDRRAAGIPCGLRLPNRSHRRSASRRAETGYLLPARPAPGHQQPRGPLCAAEEVSGLLDVLASPRFVDRSPAEVVATLLDEGQYLCAERTMYRILAANQPPGTRQRSVQPRRDRARSPNPAGSSASAMPGFQLLADLGVTRSAAPRSAMTTRLRSAGRRKYRRPLAVVGGLNDG